MVCRKKVDKIESYMSLGGGVEHMNRKMDFYYYNVSINPIVW